MTIEQILEAIEQMKVTELNELVKAAEEKFPNMPVYITPMSINVCAHVGPGTFGVGLVLKV